jgi:chemotaxis protein methyltransferase CheR
MKQAIAQSAASKADMLTEPFRFTEEDFKKITSILHEEAGIHLSSAKATLVYSRLTKRLRALGLESFHDYCALIAGEDGVDERQTMIAALTTNVTRFFREPHHFEHLKKNVVAPRAQEIRKGARLRIWSSACSDGQEPYSIAMTILSVIPEAPKLDVRILATDIDQNMIAAGKAGVYGEDAMRAVPDQMKSRWFAPVGRAQAGDWMVGDDLASLVSFRELNLVGAWPMKGKFDSIFCRNVMIYFEEATQHAILSRFVSSLVPGGYLYIGHSERMAGPALQDFASDGVTTYRLSKGGRA